MTWWQSRPRWLRWSTVAAIMAGLVGIANFAKALDTLDPWFVATRGYVAETLRPIMVLTLENRVWMIDAKQEVIRARLDMAEGRLRIVPTDQVVRDARDALKLELAKGEEVLAQVKCTLRQAQGLTCQW